MTQFSPLLKFSRAELLSAPALLWLSVLQLLWLSVSALLWQAALLSFHSANSPLDSWRVLFVSIRVLSSVASLPGRVERSARVCPGTDCIYVPIETWPQTRAGQL
uniref:Uncharacterized protein n=1 Tax=Cacopsylla melanoneura TaxID=428564 RepID=A0A8D8SAN3_9HEMI